MPSIARTSSGVALAAHAYGLHEFGYSTGDATFTGLSDRLPDQSGI